MSGNKPSFHLKSYPWYVSDWRMSETRLRLSPLARGIYRELLDQCFLDGSLPDDEKMLARIADVPLREFRREWEHVSLSFVSDGNGRLRNCKVDEVLPELERWHQQKRRAGQAGGAAAAKRSLQQPSSERLADAIAALQPSTSTSTSNTPPIVPLPGDGAGFTLSPAPEPAGRPSPRRKRSSASDWVAWKQVKFDEFWDSVWAKLSKHESEQEWARCATSPEEADRIIAACKAQAPRLKAEGDQRIAEGKQGHLHPNRWLKRKRYDDEPVSLNPRLVGVPIVEEPVVEKTAAQWREDAEFFRSIGRPEDAARCEERAKEAEK